MNPQEIIEVAVRVAEEQQEAIQNNHGELSQVRPFEVEATQVALEIQEAVDV